MQAHTTERNRLGIEAPRDLRDVRRFSHEAMATVFEVHAVHDDEKYAAQAAQAAFDLADRLERELSRFIPNSDIGRINALAPGERTQVAPTTIECLVIARHAFALTGGAFDVSIGTGLDSLELDIDACGVESTRAGVKIDLGGVGKGYAVDLMAELLEEWGLEHVLVHGGFSSVLALEPPARHDGWPLTLSTPGAHSRVFATVSLRQTAMGASGVRKTDHIVDPGTGEPVRNRSAAWVAVPRPRPSTEGPRLAAAAISDALTTAFMMLPVDTIEALCDETPGMEAWIVEGGSGDEPVLLHIGAGQPDRPR